MGNFESGHPVEHGQEGLLVQAAEIVGRGLAEQHLGGLDGILVLRLAVHHHRHFAGQQFLQFAALRAGAVRFDGGFDGSAVEHREDLDIALGIQIADIQPELVELVRAGALRVEPDVALLGLAELAAVRLGDQRAGQGVGLFAQHAADQLRAGGDIAPLVGAAELQVHVAVLVEPEEIVALQQLVGELGEAHALARIAAEALLHRILAHHIVDRDKLSDIAGEVDEGVVLHPVVVVHQLGLVGSVALEIQEAGELGLDALHVVGQGGFVQQVALGALHGRVADHAGGAAHQGERLVAAGLEVLQDHDAHQVADMQAVARGVDAHIGRHRTLFQFFFRARGDVVDHPAPFELFYKVFHFQVAASRQPRPLRGCQRSYTPVQTPLPCRPCSRRWRRFRLRRAG